jgi:hypothetical protein
MKRLSLESGGSAERACPSLGVRNQPPHLQQRTLERSAESVLSVE